MARLKQLLTFAVFCVYGVKTQVCDVQEREETTAPEFDDGENLSFNNCGHQEHGYNPPWRVRIRGPQHSCKGLLISKTAVITHDCVQAITDFEQQGDDFIAHLGDCFENLSKEKSCTSVNKGLKLKVVNASRIVAEPRNEIILWTIEKVKFFNKFINPICLFNRNGTNFLDGKESYMVYNDALPYFMENAVQSSMANCINELTFIQEDCPNLNLSLCVTMGLNYYDFRKRSGEHLLNFHRNRFYLRGVVHRIYGRGQFRAHTDLLPIMEKIVSASNGIWIMPKVPESKKATKFGSDLENLSFPGCGSKKVTRAKRYLKLENTSVTPDVAYLVSGYSSTPRDHPWHAEIKFTDASIKHGFCGGSLISKRAVLTAAHCFFMQNKTISPSELTVTLGLYDVRNRSTRAVQSKTPSRLILHPEYDQNAYYDHDVALLVFSTEFSITDRVWPICLWNEDYSLESIASTTGVVFGWGYQENYQQSDILQRANVPIRSYRECYLQRKSFFGQFMKPGFNFCAGYVNGTTTCNGDSGGGLAIRRNGKWFVRGIESFSRGRYILRTSNIEPELVCYPGHYSLYTDLGTYMEWIVQNVPDLNKI